MATDSNLPAPLVPADTTINGLHSFLLNVDRLFASELWAISTGDEFKAAMALWGRAWQQSPPGSLPDDERLLAAFSGAGSRWKKVRDVALRGFVKCSDGRLYHKVLCEDVMRAFESKQKRLERTAAASEARRNRETDENTPPPGGKKANGINKTGDRNDQRNDGRNGARDDDRNVLRHEQRNDAPTADVTINVTSTHSRAEQSRKKEREEEGEATAVVCTPPHAATMDPDIPFLPPLDEAEAGSASPRSATPWASRENLARVEAICRKAMRSGGPQDLRVSPIAKLESQGFDLENEIVPALLDIEASSTKPFKAWVHLAYRARERILAERKLAAEADKRAADGIPPDTKMVRLGHLGDFAEPVLLRYIEAWRESPTCWFAFLGPKPGEPGCLIPARLLELVEAA